MILDGKKGAATLTKTSEKHHTILFRDAAATHSLKTFGIGQTALISNRLQKCR